MKAFLFVVSLGFGFILKGQHKATDKNSQQSPGEWTITPTTGLSKGTGRMNLAFPAGAEWSVDVYNSSKKFITNYSSKDQRNSGDKNNYSDLSPGIYHFKLNTVMVENVPIEEGKLTSLKVGVCETNASRWELRSGTREKFLTSGNTPKKLVLPVGKYQIKEDGVFRVVDIGEITESLSPEAIGETGKHYVMTPSNANQQGRLILTFTHAQTNAFWAVITHVGIYKHGESDFLYGCPTPATICPPDYPLEDGEYDVYFNLSGEGRLISPFIVPKIPIRTGFETRLKVGHLVHKAKGYYTLKDDLTDRELMRYYQAGSAALPLPVGNYSLLMDHVGQYNVEIRDEEETIVSPLDSTFVPQPKYKIQAISNRSAIQPRNKGRLNCSFPESPDLKLIIKIPNASGSGYTSIFLDTLTYYDILPGKYSVALNQMELEVPLEVRKETIIRHGYLNLDLPTGRLWRIKSINAENNSFSLAVPMKLALPIGYYHVQVQKPENGAWEDHTILITDGQTINFKWPAD